MAISLSFFLQESTATSMFVVFALRKLPVLSVCKFSQFISNFQIPRMLSYYSSILFHQEIISERGEDKFFFNVSITEWLSSWKLHGKRQSTSSESAKPCSLMTPCPQLALNCAVHEKKKIHVFCFGPKYNLCLIWWWEMSWKSKIKFCIQNLLYFLIHHT